MKKNFRQLVLFCFLFIFSNKEINAQQACWTSVGSAGTVDETDRGIIALSSNIAAVNPSTLATTVDVRYNIVATDGLFGGECDVKTLKFRYIDNGSTARVTIRLYKVNITNGTSTILTEFNSNNITPSNTPQTRTAPSFSETFNFFTYAYYIEIQLNKTNTSGNPQIHALQICAAGVCLQGQDTSHSAGNLNVENASLEQNIPNPFNKTTTIKYTLPQKFTNAKIVITNKNGNALKLVNISGSGKGTVSIDAATLPAGTYNYALIVDGKILGSKQMVLTK